MGVQSTRIALPLACLTLIAAPARAQDERPTGYPRSANERREGTLTLSAVYTADFGADVAGGRARGVRYLDNLDLQAALDLNGLVGWHGARAFGYVIRDNGTSLSTLSGDAQGVSNIETAVPATRLFEAWIEQDIGRRASVKAGLYNLNAEFDTTVSGGLFRLSSHGVGPELAQSGRRGPSIFPVTSLALRGEVGFGTHWLLHAAVLDAVPGDPDRPAATAIRLRRADGALLVAELGWLDRATKLAIGSWRYTAPFAPIGDPTARGRGNAGGYVLAERQLVGDTRGGAGVSGWLRYGVADARYNAITSYLGGGLVRSGTWRGRDDDQFGVSLACARFGDRHRALVDTGARELILEAAYRWVAARWLSLEPDAQYVIDPSGRRDIPDALVLALRVKVGR
jgi:porin